MLSYVTKTVYKNYNWQYSLSITFKQQYVTSFTLVTLQLFFKYVSTCVKILGILKYASKGLMKLQIILQVIDTKKHNINHVTFLSINYKSR